MKANDFRTNFRDAIERLTKEITALSKDVAVLTDRREDAHQLERGVRRLQAAVQALEFQVQRIEPTIVRVDALEKESIESKASTKTAKYIGNTLWVTLGAGLLYVAKRWLGAG